MNEEKFFEDIINLPHHVSQTHPPLGRDSYAAQFSPFAALTGYDGIVAETERTTEKRPELDDDAKEAIRAVLSEIVDHISESPEIEADYFLPDARKSGGEIRTVRGVVRAYDNIEQVLIFADGKRVPAEDLLGIRFAPKERST